MKNLNRKQYKEQIKNFRSANPLAKVQHQWVTFRDEYNKDVLMFVHNSIIVRENPNRGYNKYNCFKVGPHLATVMFYGYPALAFDHINGIKINRWMPSYFKVNVHNNFRILTGAKVNKCYCEIFDKAKVWNISDFKDKEV